MKRLVFICFLVIIASRLWCQLIPKSVYNSIANKDPKQQVMLLDSMAIKYRDTELAISTAISRYAIQISRSKNFTKPTVRLFLTLARTYRTHGLYDTSLAYIDSARKFAIKNKITGQYANISDFEGLTYMRMGNYETAAGCFFKCIEYAEKEKDSLRLHNGFEHLGSLNFYRQDYKSAVRFYKKSLAFINPVSNKSIYVSTLDNLGLGFSNLKQYDSALFYQKRSVEVIEQLGDSSLLAESYINLGSTLMNLKKYKEAELIITKAYTIDLALGKDYAIQLSNLYMGKVYMQTGRIKMALPYLEKSLDISEKLKIFVQIKESASNLSSAYEDLGDYQRANLYYKKLVDIMEKISKEENARAINELSTKYETKKKQQEIQLLTQDKQLKEHTIEKDRYIKIFTAIVAVLLLLLSVFFIYRFSEKKKDNNLLQEKNDAIAAQKNEIEEKKEELQHKNKEITDSINYAKRIQGSVLPSNKLLKTVFSESFIYFQPKDIVSGDFYWLAQNNNYIYYAVADCTGHGVPGAMMSMLGNSLLNQIVLNSKLESPAAILKELHFHVVKTLNENMQQRDSKDGMDIALIRIDLKSKVVLYAGAGRPLYLIKNKELKIYKADKYSIGGIYDTEEVNYALHEIKIDSSTQLYLFTDGVPDQFGGPKGKKFMSKQLQEILLQNCGLSLNEQEVAFKTAFESWKGKVEQTDDVTLISIRLS
ncbi:MAG: tetratricopeptide repeat protein [Bacteroidetes bacterium]|nr:tetratricopeptide repeat protein [Bacteroidota bacterium]